MTQRQMAERVTATGLPCSHSYIGKIEQGGQASPGREVLAAFADVLGCPRSEAFAAFGLLPEDSLEAMQPDLYRVQRILESLTAARRRRVVDAFEELVGAPSGA